MYHLAPEDILPEHRGMSANERLAQGLYEGASVNRYRGANVTEYGIKAPDDTRFYRHSSHRDHQGGNPASLPEVLGRRDGAA